MYEMHTVKLVCGMTYVASSKMKNKEEQQNRKAFDNTSGRLNKHIKCQNDLYRYVKFFSVLFIF